MRKLIIVVIFLSTFISLAFGVSPSSIKSAQAETSGLHFDPDKIPAKPDYSDKSNWAALPEDKTLKPVDTLFFHPTSFFSDKIWNQDMPSAIDNKETAFQIKSKASVFTTSCNLYAPFYRQASIMVLSAEADDKDKALSVAYEDIEAAFDYYLKHYNMGRPFILAGHSQGSNLLLWLLERRFNNPDLRKILITAYVIGWSVTRDDLKTYPHLAMCESPDQTGCIVSYNTQERNPQFSIVRPNAVGINPLIWNASGDFAPKEKNIGAVIYTDDQVVEIPHFTEAQTVNGALIIPRPKDMEYIKSPYKGFYHSYDYSFFYRNIEENVSERIKAFR